MKSLQLDLSTSSTGYSLLQNRKLKKYGVLKPKIKGIYKQKYPLSSLRKIIGMTLAIDELVKEIKPDVIWIEEVNRGISRKTQKPLDGLHFFVYLSLLAHLENDKIRYIDSDGSTGWRTILNLKLTPEDRKKNRKLKKPNKITKKHLACRYVNTHLNLSLDVDLHKTDADKADALGMALALMKSRQI